mmetsp:Transcript_2856/g.3224  ORF Transcript_2856/g.3224 Transcript_2856/m.3224 type:complete len:513 (+) Transcript_2856:88-1626(+)
MSACGSTCESDWQFRGVPGVCNETTGECICPPGFNGVDDWEVFNDCHIDIDFRLRVRYGLIAFSLFQALFAGFSLLYLSKRKGSTLFWLVDGVLNRCSETRRRQQREQKEELLERRKNSYNLGSGTYITEIPPALNNEEDGDSLFSDLEDELEIEIAKQQEFANIKKEGGRKQQKKKAKNNPKPKTIPLKDTNSVTKTNGSRKSVIDTNYKLLLDTNRRATILTALFFSYGVSNFVYQIMFLTFSDVDSRVANNPYQNLAIGYSISAMVGGFWYMVYLWYRSLPELTVYGKLFGLSKLFIRFNRWVRYICFFFVTLTFTVFTLLLYVLPLVNPDRLEVWNRATMLAIIAFVLAAQLFLTFVIAMLLKVYSSSLEALDLRKRTVRLQAQAEEESKPEGNQRNVDTPFKITIIKPATASETLDVEANILEKEKEIKRARLTQIALLGFSWLGVIFCFLLIILLLFVEFVKTNYYIFFTALTVVASCAAIFLNYIVVFRGLRKEKKGDNVSSSSL